MRSIGRGFGGSSPNSTYRCLVLPESIICQWSLFMLIARQAAELRRKGLRLLRWLTGRTSVILRRPLQAIENACSDGSRTTRLAVKARPRIRQGSRVSFGLSCSGIAPWRKPLPEHVAIDRARSLSASWAEDV